MLRVPMLISLILYTTFYAPLFPEIVEMIFRKLSLAGNTCTGNTYHR